MLADVEVVIVVIGDHLGAWLLDIRHKWVLTSRRAGELEWVIAVFGDECVFKVVAVSRAHVTHTIALKTHKSQTQHSAGLYKHNLVLDQTSLIMARCTSLYYKHS